MNKRLSVLAFAFLPLILSACSNVNPSSEEKNESSLEDNNSSEVVSSNDASQEDASSSETNSLESSSEDETSEDEFISFWGNDAVEEAIEKSIKYDVPYYFANSYEVEVSKDVLNDDVLTIYFKGYKEDEVDIQRDKYVNVCISAGYKTSSQKIDDGNSGQTTLYTLSKSIGNRQNIQISVVSGRKTANSEYCFAAFCSRFYDYKSEIFPNYVLDHYFNYTLPVVEDNSAMYSCRVDYNDKTQMKSAYIEISNVNQNYEHKLYQLLERANYVMDANYYEDYGYMATSADKSYEVQFKYCELASFDGYGIAMFTWPL